MSIDKGERIFGIVLGGGGSCGSYDHSLVTWPFDSWVPCGDVMADELSVGLRSFPLTQHPTRTPSHPHPHPRSSTHTPRLACVLYWVPALDR